MTDLEGQKLKGPLDEPEAPSPDESGGESRSAEDPGVQAEQSGPATSESDAAENAVPSGPGKASAESPVEEPAAEADPAEEGGEPAAPDDAGQEEAEAARAAPDDKKQWYIIHTYSGFENKVLQSLRQRADAYGMGDKIGEILVPTEDVAEIRDGKKVVTKKKIFPGYVLVNMEMSDEAWHVVRSTPKVTGFLGTGQKPLPMPQEEVNRILNQVHVTKEKPKPKFDYRVGETVKITDGPFSNFTGVVEEVNEDRSTLKVMVSIFGRATPVELEFHQVKRPE